MSSRPHLDAFRVQGFLLGAVAVTTFFLVILSRPLQPDAAFAACVLATLALVLGMRRAAAALPSAARSRCRERFALIGAHEIALLVGFLALLVVFYLAFDRASSDGREYFVQTRSLLVDHDLDFANEVARFGTSGMPEMFPFGSAVLWTPFYLAAHIGLGALNLLGGDWPRDGFFNAYQQAVGLGTLIWGYLGLILVYRIVHRHFSRGIALASVTVVTGGSFILWYLVVDSSFSHGNSLFAVALFLWLWQRAREPTQPDPRGAGRGASPPPNPRSRRSPAERRGTGGCFALGLAGGLMTMVRWQNALFLLFIVADLLSDVRSSLDSDDDRLTWATAGRRLLLPYGLVGVGGFLAFLPQMAFWKVVQGGWLTMPHGQTGQQWWGDSLMADVLFSSNHGLFAWHPLLLLAVLGIPLALLRTPRLVGLLTLIFAAQIYVNGAVATWWGGTGFGARRFASLTPLFALGMAASLRWLLDHRRTAVAALLSGFLVLNATFMLSVGRGELPNGEGLTFDTISGTLYRRVGNPFAMPAAAWWSWRAGISLPQYDALGRQLYNNLFIDVGTRADSRFLGRGWSAPESVPGTTYRWATGTESTLVVPFKAPIFLERGEPQRQPDYVLRLWARPFGYEGAPEQSLTVEINGERVAVFPLSPGMEDYELRVPGHYWQRNLNLVTFRYAWTASPAEVGAGPDPRPLSVQFDRVDFLRQGR